MRTTITFDPDVALLLKRRVADGKATLKQIVNAAVRAGLASLKEERPVKFKVKTYPMRFKAGIDLNRLNHLADDLEDEAILKKLYK